MLGRFSDGEVYGAEIHFAGTVRGRDVFGEILHTLQCTYKR